MLRPGSEKRLRVTFDQLLRRLSWRVRRWVRRPADNDPIVSVEPAPAALAPAPAATPSARGGRRRRWARTIISFLLTLAVLGLGYGALIAVNSRVALDLTATPAVAEGQSHTVAAAAALFALGADSANLDAHDLLFIPSGRRMRERRVRDGATAAAARFVMLAAQVNRRPDPALTDARLAIGDGAALEDAQRAVARDALLRLNARIVDKRASLDVAAPALAAIMRAAADACEEQSRALAVLAAAPGWLAAPAMEARMYQSRGVAYGWVMLMRAALADAPELAAATTLEASIPVTALQQIAERQPLFLFNGDPNSPWAPAHVADTAADFTRAAIGARALASALEQHAR